VVRSKPAPPPGWEDTPAGKLLAPFIPQYSGDAAPITWNRVPGERLKP
jgi:hypothetical protein